MLTEIPPKPYEDARKKEKRKESRFAIVTERPTRLSPMVRTAISGNK